VSAYKKTNTFSQAAAVFTAWDHSTSLKTLSAIPEGSCGHRGWLRL
jgi:hypothetical protein